MTSHRAVGAALALLCALTLAASCATTGATYRSGVGDRFLEQPPYYAGAAAAAAERPIGHMPIAYQRGAVHAPMFDPTGEPGSAIAGLLAEMNTHLDGLGRTTRLASAHTGGTPPDVHFGCVAAADGECDDARRVDSDGRIRMRLAVGRPSAGWVAATRDALTAGAAASTLVITLEIGQYWIQPRGWRNHKTVELGTGYTVRLPWLTSLETPVNVLQLTGALLDADGRALRIGAEGLIARRSNLLVSAAGAQRLISDEDVAELRRSRREDLPGAPLVWQVALENLVAQLTVTSGTAIR
jgi:hypothetical protein